MAQFQEMMRQQLESSMHTELEKLLDTVVGAEKEVRWLLPLHPSGCDLQGGGGDTYWSPYTLIHTYMMCRLNMQEARVLSKHSSVLSA